MMQQILLGLGGAVYDVSGGTQIVDGSSTYNIFLSPDTYEVSGAGQGTVELLVIAAGGGGGGANDRVGGGGGAGQVNYYPAFAIEARTYNLAVGSGGSPGQNGANGGKGEDSHFDPGGSTPVPANGGGYGGGGSRSNPSNPGGPGGSGGAGVGWDNPRPGGSSILNSLPVPGGTAYGNGSISQSYGGGGGAGTPGSGNTRNSSFAGDGQPFPSFPAPVIAPAIPAPVRPAWTEAVGSSGYFGGGGSSSGRAGFNVTGGYQGPTYAGGWGGGGSGHPSGGPNQGPGLPGVNYTGGGSAGSWIGSPGGDGGTGGSGIIIVKYTEA